MKIAQPRSSASPNAKLRRTQGRESPFDHLLQDMVLIETVGKIRHSRRGAGATAHTENDLKSRSDSRPKKKDRRKA